MSSSLPSKPPARDEPVSFERVVGLLAPALGREKSHELIESRARALGHHTDRLNVERTLQILSSLANEQGIVGVSARFAKTRLTTQEKSRPSQPWLSERPAPELETAPARTSMQTSARTHEAPPERARASAGPECATLTSKEIAELLAASLGTEKSIEVVLATMVRLNIASGELTMEQAQAILNLIAKAPGIVGVAARFAKARLFLRSKQEG